MVPTTDRAAVGMMLEGLDGTIDLIIPRGGKGLVGARAERSARAGAGASGRHLPRLYPRGRRPRKGARHRAQRQDAAHRNLRRGGDAVDRPRGAEIARAADSGGSCAPRAARSAATRTSARVFPSAEAGERRGLAHRISRRHHLGEGRGRHRGRDPPHRDLRLASHRSHRHRGHAPPPSGSSGRSIPRS